MAINMKKRSIYLMPGMAASPNIFEYLKLSEHYEVNCLSWITPNKNEPLSDYAQRMCVRIKDENPILVGVSFGGLLVQEISRFLKCEKVIIISSIKSNQELPAHMKIAQKTNLHKLLPTQWIENIESLAMFAFGKDLKRRVSLYQRYLSERDHRYLDWSINQLVNWNRSKADKTVIHIHGLKDSVFPIKNIQKPYIEIEGNHSIVLTQSQWLNKNLPKIISNNIIDLDNLEGSNQSFKK